MMETTRPDPWVFFEGNWPDTWPFATGWPGFFLEIDGQAAGFEDSFFHEKKQTTHLLEGWAERSATAHLPGGRLLKVHAKQFAHIGEEGCSAMRFALTAVNFSGRLRLSPFLDFSEKCREREDGSPFFVETARESDADSSGLLLESADGRQRTAAAFRFTVYQDGEEADFASQPMPETAPGQIGRSVEVDIEPLQETVLFRFDARFFEKKKTRSRILDQSVIDVNRLFVRGFQQLLEEQSGAWLLIWRGSELADFQPTAASQPLFRDLWRLLDGWLQPDFFSKNPAATGQEEAAALAFFCENAAPVFLRKSLIDRHLRSARSVEAPAFGLAVGEYLRRAGFPKSFLEKGIETLVACSRFWFETGEAAPAFLLEKNFANLSSAIAACKKTDPETWRSLMIRIRFEEKREMKKWTEKLREI